MNTNVAILAAGLGRRMRSKRAKVLHRAGGKALIEHVVAAASAVAPAGRMVVVTGYQAPEVEALLAPLGVRFARQAEQKGTGDAVRCARAAMPDEAGLVMVLYGDTPLLTAATLERLRDLQSSSDAAATLITTTLADPAGYGRVMMEGDEVREIVEEQACSDAQRRIRRINSGIYCFRADLLWKHIGEVAPDNPAKEFYLTDMPAILARHGHKTRAMHVGDPTELAGINTRMELAEADRALRRRKNEELMLCGVTIERPETVSIDVQATVGADTVIEPGARILGESRIGENCAIGAGAILESCVLESGAIIKPYTVATEARIEGGAQVGPFARLRKGADIGPNAKIGNFVEVKNSRVGAGSKSQHLAYLGDAAIGERVNVGAGTITCNYDGEKKHQTKIGDRAFIGSNATLVAPLEIGEEAYIGAGSVITDAVPDGALALGRERQVVKTGWVARRKKADSKP